MDHIDDNDHESPSFRHLSRQNPFFCQSPTFESLLQEANGCASATLLSPESSPLLVPRSPAESRWSFSSPPPTPPFANHHHHPVISLLHHCMFSLRHRDGSLHSIAVARGLVFTGSDSNNIRAWQQTNCSEMGYVQASSGEVRAMLAHGNMLFTSHKDNKIRVWTIGSDGPASSSSSCSCDRKHLGTSSFRPRKLMTLPKPRSLQRFLFSKKSSQQHRDTVSCMAYNLAEGLLYTGSHDKTVKAWRLSDKKCVDSFAAHADSINDMVINEDGYIFTCSSDGTVKMWSKVCGETFHTLTTTLDFQQFPVHALALTAVSVSEGSFLYSGSSDGCIYFWGQQMSGEYSHRGCIQGHQFGVLCLAVVEDIVVSGSADTTIKIWRRVNKWREGDYKVCHECVGVLEGHKGPVKCIKACLEEDSFVRSFLVFSAGLDRMFKVWKVKILPETNRSLNHHLVDDNNGEEFSCYGKYLMEIDASPVLSPRWVKEVQHSIISD